MANYKTTYNGKPVEITQERYSQFLKDNPGDVGRIGKAFADDDDNLANNGAGKQTNAAASPAPAAAPTPTPAPSPATAALGGLAGAGGGSPAAASEFKPITSGGATGTSSLIPSAPSPDSAGSQGGGIVSQGGMIPGPGFVESGAGAGALRGLGQRRLPEQSMALAGLSRAY